MASEQSHNFTNLVFVMPSLLFSIAWADGLKYPVKNLTSGLFLAYVQLFYRRIRKLPKALKEWQAFLDLKKTIDDFSECCPLLEMMAHKAMRPRHWERISTITSVTLDVESETFQLRQLMSAPLLPNKEDIEVGFNLLTYEFW